MNSFGMMRTKERNDFMKVVYTVPPKRGEYNPDKFFTFGKEYKVLANYRNRQSGQRVADNGFVVMDNQGCENMLFPNQIKIVDDGEDFFRFSYKQ